MDLVFKDFDDRVANGIHEKISKIINERLPYETEQRIVLMAINRLYLDYFGEDARPLTEGDKKWLAALPRPGSEDYHRLKDFNLFFEKYGPILDAIQAEEASQHEA